MAAIRISALVPRSEDLLALEVEEAGGVLLIHLNSLQNNENPVVRQGLINQHNFFNSLAHNPEYPGHQDKVDGVLMEAWCCLESAGFLARAPDTVGALFFVTRRGLRLKSREDFTTYRKASLLPKAQIHPLIAGYTRLFYEVSTTLQSSKPSERLKFRSDRQANFPMIWWGIG